MSSIESAISIRSVSKKFGSFTALEDISFEILSGEFFTLLGPSGCGKTTLLRLIGGFETTTEGVISLYGQEIENLPANKRPINTVFQQYALFPHMTVTQNIKFGMKMLGFSDDKQDKRAKEMLSLVQLEKFAHRKPSELSGGQQQRVALARALAPEPKVLLLDEPLSALDLKLRQAMRIELKNIQQRTGITFVFVTHDQEEALAMSDRIAVMSAGKVQQIGSAKEIYEEPKNSFVADFIGETNLIDVKIDAIADKQATCSFVNSEYQGSFVCHAPESAKQGCTAKLSIRPERLNLELIDPKKTGLLEGVIQDIVYMGTSTLYVVSLVGGVVIYIRLQNGGGNNLDLKTGRSVNIFADFSSARLFLD